MRKIKRILPLLLSSLFIISSLAGCNKSSDDSNNNSNENSSISETNYTGKGVHDVSVIPTQEYLVKDSETEYVLLLPKNAMEYEIEAANLINEFMKKAANVEFPIVYSNNVKAEQGKYISLGDTTLMRNSGISVDLTKFGESGFKIVTKDDDVYISGARGAFRKGTYYAAQDFLKYTIGWRAYTIDEVKFTVSKDVAFYDFDVTEIPEFDTRRYGVKNLEDNVTYQRYMRNTIKDEEWIPFSGHSHFTVLHPSIYYAEHKDWYYISSKYVKPEEYVQGDKCWNAAQICLTNEELIEEFCSQLVQWFRNYPNANFVHLGQMDNTLQCQCSSCVAKKAELNTNDAGVMVWFTNKVAREVTKRIQETEPTRQLTFEMFAYYSSIAPPVNEVDGKYVAHHAEVIPDSNVMVQFTPLGSVITETIDHPSNQKFYNYLKGWKALTNNISTWTYGTNFYWLIFNNKNWDIATKDLRTYSELGVTSVYNQCAKNINEAQLVEMRIWVESQLMWNTSLNYQDLVEEFIENYYGVAAPYILKMFDAMTTYYEYLRTQKGCTGGAYFTLDKKEYWSFGYVESIRKIMENALAEVEKLRETDPAAYQKYYWRVGGAYIENLYMQMEYYGGDYGATYCEKAINLFESFCNRLNITGMIENNSITMKQYISKWRAIYV